MDKDYHKINKETYEMQLKLHLSGYYSSRLIVNMYPLATDECSLIYELYFPSSSIDSSTVQISAASSVETISKVTTNVFSDPTRAIIHYIIHYIIIIIIIIIIRKYNNVALNRLTIDMVLKNKTGVACVNNLTILLFTESKDTNIVLIQVFGI